MTRNGEPLTHSRRARKSVLINVGLLGLSLLVSVLLAEVTVRVIAPQQLILKRPDIWQAADTIGWTHQPNVATTINTGERTVRLFTDAEGYRVAAGGRREGEFNILLLGDSFMEALQVEYEKSLAGLLEATLTTRLATPVSVRNTAVGGWRPDQYLLRARRALERERFDIVLVALYLGNDIIRDRREVVEPRTPKEVHRFRLPRSFRGREIIDAVFYPINDFLEVRSHLFIFMKQGTRGILMRLGLSAAYFPREFLISEADSKRWVVTAEVCQDIERLALRHDVPTLFLLIPTHFQVNDEILEEHLEVFGIHPDSVDLSQPNRLMHEALEDRNLAFIDLLPPLREAARRGAQLYGRIDEHLTAQGHRVIVESLAPLVQALLKGDDLSIGASALTVP